MLSKDWHLSKDWKPINWTFMYQLTELCLGKKIIKILKWKWWKWPLLRCLLSAKSWWLATFQRMIAIHIYHAIICWGVICYLYLWSLRNETEGRRRRHSAKSPYIIVFHNHCNRRRVYESMDSRLRVEWRRLYIKHYMNERQYMYTSPTQNEGIRDVGSRIPNREKILLISIPLSSSLSNQE